MQKNSALFDTKDLEVEKCISGLYAITDSISASGLKDGFYKFAETDIQKKANRITLKETETLAGSAITMHETFLKKSIFLESKNSFFYIYPMLFK